MVTDADRAVLEFLAEHRLARTNQIAQLLDVTVGAADRRLRRLARAGYVTSGRIYSGQPQHHAIAGPGLKVIESRLGVPTFDQMAYRHDVGLAWLWLAARAGAFGRPSAIYSERQMRSADGRAADGEERFGVNTLGWGRRGGRLTHFPDLVVETAGGHRVAIELELTIKSRSRLDTIMRRYAADRRIDAVLYLVDGVGGTGVARAVQSAAAGAGATELVHVQSIRWSERAGPPHARGSVERSGTARRSPGMTRYRAPAAGASELAR